jgi:hypothetical protein
LSGFKDLILKNNDEFILKNIKQFYKYRGYAMYESLLRVTDKEKIEIVYRTMCCKIKGLYYDGIIAINRNISTTAEKSCVLAEELGHHYTSYGNIVDTSIVVNRKQEEIAKRWAVHRLIKVSDLIRAFKSGARNKYEVAEYLGVTELFLDKAIEVFSRKYGTYKIIDDWVVYFNPFGYLRRL